MRSTVWTAAVVTLTAFGLTGCNTGFRGMFSENRPKLPSLGWGKGEETAVASAQPQYQPAASTAASVPAVAMNPGYGQNYPTTGAAAYAQPAATSYPGTAGSYPTTAGGYANTSVATPAYGATAGGYGQTAPYSGYSGTPGAGTTAPQSGYYNPANPTSGATAQYPQTGGTNYGGSTAGMSGTGYPSTGYGPNSGATAPGAAAAYQADASSYPATAYPSSNSGGYNGAATTAPATGYESGSVTTPGANAAYASPADSSANARYDTGSRYDAPEPYAGATSASSGTNYPSTQSYTEDRYGAAPAGNYGSSSSTTQAPGAITNPHAATSTIPNQSYQQPQTLGPMPGQEPAMPAANPHYRPGSTGDYIPPGGASVTPPTGLPGRSLSGSEVAPAGYEPQSSAVPATKDSGNSAASVYTPPASSMPNSTTAPAYSAGSSSRN